MTVNKKIHEDSDFNNAEKTAENVLHWVVTNKNIVLGIAVVIIAVYAGISSISYSKNKAATEAKTAYGALFIEQVKYDTLNVANAVSLIENTTESDLAAYTAYQLATSALSNSKFEDAISWFDKAISNRPSSALIMSAIYEGKGVALESTGDEAAALELYKKSLSAKKSSFRANDVRYKIALLQNKNGEKDAVKTLCEAISNDSTATPELKQNADNLLLAL